MSISSVSSASYHWQAMTTTKNRQNVIDTSMTALASTTTATPTVATAAPVASSQDGAASQFKNYMSMSSNDRMQYAWLAQHGISKEQFDAMSADDKKKLVAEMKQDLETKMKQSVENKANKTTNLLA